MTANMEMSHPLKQSYIDAGIVVITQNARIAIAFTPRPGGDTSGSSATPTATTGRHAIETDVLNRKALERVIPPGITYSWELQLRWRIRRSHGADVDGTYSKPRDIVEGRH
jgi:hypothetical protein